MLSLYLPLRGEPEAIDTMLQKIKGMEDQILLTIWRDLGDYNPDEYYSPSGHIQMDTWAEAIYNELNARSLPTRVIS